MDLRNPPLADSGAALISSDGVSRTVSIYEHCPVR
jgi:hypothetical protein